MTWKCFHCEEEFTLATEARLHFGPSVHSKPSCQVPAEELRALEAELHRYREEDTDLHRTMWGMRSKHAEELRREEEKGYARGLRDMFLELYPHLIEAAKHILYDNGMVNATTTEAQQLGLAQNRMRKHCSVAELGAAEVELAAMSAEQLLEVCCGERNQDWSDVLDKVLNCCFESLMPEANATRIKVAVPDDEPRVDFLAKLSPFTRDFANPPMSLKAMRAMAFSHREVLIAEVFKEKRWQAAGFIWCRPMKPKHMPFSTVYYMGVHPDARCLYFGKKLLRAALERAKEGRVELVCERGNEAGYSFYTRCGGQPIKDGTVGKDERPYTRFAFTKGQL